MCDLSTGDISQDHKSTMTAYNRPFVYFWELVSNFVTIKNEVDWATIRLGITP